MSETLNIVDVKYARSGQSTKPGQFGMREMQAKVWEKRDSNHLLIKAPPASGKSRALMYIALDKLVNQGRRKAIVAVPEKSIGSSFENTPLSEQGFFADWVVEDRNNLCLGSGDDKSKVVSFAKFMASEDRILICTHSTLRFALAAGSPEDLNGCVLAIDEFHHVSTHQDSKLGGLLKDVMRGSDVQIIAMTGSYFRGDNEAILSPEAEREFDKVTYTYYDQLNGYNYLETLGIGYHFYQGRYLDDKTLSEVLDTKKKTIVHIPNVNSRESTGLDKYEEVEKIIDVIGKWDRLEPDTGIDVVISNDGRTLRVANLVNDDPIHRTKLSNYLARVAKKDIDAVDIIIALGMAKEGFDWPYCEHALTIGYRDSLTEVVQIIGRCTRDSSNKTHAQFTNLIAKPKGTDDESTVSVNNMLKAISASLLMEQVLAPNFTFAPMPKGPREDKPGTLYIRGLKEAPSENAFNIVQSDLEDLTAAVLTSNDITKASAKQEDPTYINKVLIPKLIRQKYPDETKEELEFIRQHLVANIAAKTGSITKDESGSDKFITMAGKFINLDDLTIDLIDTINPFQRAFEVISKKMGAEQFRTIRDAMEGLRVDMTDDEAKHLVPKIKEFKARTGRTPEASSMDKDEKLLGRAWAYLVRRKAEYNATKSQEEQDE